MRRQIDAGSASEACANLVQDSSVCGYVVSVAIVIVEVRSELPQTAY